jgi:phenylalanyl-tRNA synthetase alpha chain
MNDLDTLVQAAKADFDAAAQGAGLEDAKARFLGKSGRLTELLKGLAALPPEEKKTRGAEINQAKTASRRC